MEEQEKPDRRKSRIDSVKIFRNEYEALMLFPDADLGRALEFILKWFDIYSVRGSDMMQIPQEIDYQDFDRKQARIIKSIVYNIRDECAKYWETADLRSKGKREADAKRGKYN